MSVTVTTVNPVSGVTASVAYPNGRSFVVEEYVLFVNAPGEKVATHARGTWLSAIVQEP